MKLATALRYAREIRDRLQSINGLLATPLGEREAVKFRRVWVFGSTVKGSETPNDLDIMIEAGEVGGWRRMENTGYDRDFKRSFGIKVHRDSKHLARVWLTRGMQNVSRHMRPGERIEPDVMVMIWPRWDLDAHMRQLEGGNKGEPAAQRATRKAQKRRAKAKPIEPEMIQLPRGTFLMGSPQEEPGRDRHEHQHTVTVGAFAIARCAVTFDEYNVFAREAGLRIPRDTGWGRERRPVVGVTWEKAIAYTSWLSHKTGKRYRLPSEAEWEYAARAGTTTAYWWGNDPDSNRGNCFESMRGLLPVDDLEPNPWGLYNILGNTWEWTGSLYKYPLRRFETRCASAKARGPHVARGGAWNNEPQRLRAAYRLVCYRGYSDNSIGFRLALDP